MRSRGLRYLVLGIVAAVLIALPVSAAERVYFNYGPLGFSVSVNDLEVFAKEGKAQKELGSYLNRLSPKQQAQLRALLRTPYKVNPVWLARIFYTRTGERIIRDVGELIKTKKGQNGFYGIRAALVLAAAEPEGLTVINFLRKSPTNIQLNIKQILWLVEQISTLVEETDVLVTELAQMTSDAASEPMLNFNQPDLRKSGNFGTSKQIINLQDPVRKRELIVYLYLPKASNPSKFPVLVISNGLGAHPDRFRNLAQHLASYGFAVAIPDHPGSSHQRQKEYFAGLYSLNEENFNVTEFIDRPLEVTFLLNELERLNQIEFKGQLNLEQVGVFGYSIGGSTALALAGAEINFDQLEKDCNIKSLEYISLRLVDISLRYQCRALELPRESFRLRDERIKAAFVFVPFSKGLFGQAGMSRVNIPILWEATDQDILTPLLVEQIPSFASLTSADKYLIVTKGLPHTRVTLNLTNRFMQKAQSWEEVAGIGQNYQNALSLAFFKVYVAQDEKYRRYLQASYAQAISEKPYNLSLVRSIPEKGARRIRRGVRER